MLETVFVGVFTFMVFLLFATALILVIDLVVEIVRTWFKRW